MSEDQLKAFLDAVKCDEALQAKLKSITDPSALVEIAAKAGFELSSSDLLQANATMSEEELEGLVGGEYTPLWTVSC